jgi:hypothetical protein
MIKVLRSLRAWELNKDLAMIDARIAELKEELRYCEMQRQNILRDKHKFEMEMQHESAIN